LKDRQAVVAKLNWPMLFEPLDIGECGLPHGVIAVGRASPDLAARRCECDVRVEAIGDGVVSCGRDSTVVEVNVRIVKTHRG
jgi:hypothetical protein